MCDIFDHYNCFVLKMLFVLVFVTNLKLASVDLLCTQSFFHLLCTLYCICMLRYLVCLFLMYRFRKREDTFI